MSSTGQAPHDAFVKAYFQNLDALRGELHRMLSPELIAAIDLDRIEQITTAPGPPTAARCTTSSRSPPRFTAPSPAGCPGSRC